MADTRLHWAIGDSKRTLCGYSVTIKSLRFQRALASQIFHAVHSSADTCETCSQKAKLYREEEA